jgi:hypothetical protein
MSFEQPLCNDPLDHLGNLVANSRLNHIGVFCVVEIFLNAMKIVINYFGNILK